MLFTGKGDDGSTGLFSCDNRLSKDSNVVSALGSLDELNSLLGICYSHLEKNNLGSINEFSFEQIIRDLQEDLFVIQANLAGGSKILSEDKIERVETIIHLIEKELPPIEEFVISGEFLPAAYMDYARSVARRTERDIVALSSETEVSSIILKYVNRLSSILYALARLATLRASIKEQSPKY